MDQKYSPLIHKLPEKKEEQLEHLYVEEIYPPPPAKKEDKDTDGEPERGVIVIEL